MYDDLEALTDLADQSELFPALPPEDARPGPPPSEPQRDNDDLVDVSRFTFLGPEAWARLQSEPEPKWISSPMLREGTVTLLGSPPFTGKTRLGMWLSMCAARGVAPWADATMESEVGVIYLGYDTHATAKSLRSTAHSLAMASDRGFGFRGDRVLEDPEYQKYLMIAGHSRSGVFPINRYRLDEEGVSRIESELVGEFVDRTGIRPRLFVVDTLSTALPTDIDENDNPAINRVLVNLGGLAIRQEAAVLVLHHPSKGATSKAFDMDDFNSYVRGASSMAGAVGILSGLYAPREDPRHRALTLWTNYGGMQRQWFEVCSEERAEGRWIDYWKASESPVNLDKHAASSLAACDVLGPGEELNVRQLHERLVEKKLVSSLRAAERASPSLRKRWLETDQTREAKGARSSILTQLAEPPSGGDHGDEGGSAR
jgi:hypothetical protein